MGMALALAGMKDAIVDSLELTWRKDLGLNFYLGACGCFCDSGWENLIVFLSVQQSWRLSVTCRSLADMHQFT